MVTELQPQKVHRAFSVILGRKSTPQDLPRLLPLSRAALKKFYHERAIKSHPDTAGGDGRIFRDVHLAYKFLDQALLEQPENLESIIKVIPPAQGPNKVPARKSTAPVSGRAMPSHPLRFGQFLCRRGLINLEILIRSLVWQHSQRPRFGYLAVDNGFLTLEDLPGLLFSSKPGEKIGEAACRLGLMDNFQRIVVLGDQRRYKAEVGRFYLEEGILTPGQLASELQAHRNHNLRYSNFQG